MTKSFIIPAALILLLSTSFAFAQSAPDQPDGSDPTLQLQNLVYYPHAQQYVLTSQFQSPFTDKSTGNNTTTTSYYQLTLGATYGINDRVRVAISETELFDERIQTDNGTTTTANHANGLSNPQLTAIYRTVQNQTDGRYADINLSVTPKISTHQAATGGQTGDNLSASWIVTLSAPFYWIKGRNEIEVDPELTNHFSGESDGATANGTTTTNSYWVPALVFADRYHFNQQFYLEPILTANFGYSLDSTNQGTGIDTTSTYKTWLTPQLQAGYLFKSWCLATLAVSYANHTHTNSPSGGNSTDVTNNETIATLGGRFTF